jgi:hypothetical protein
MDAKELMGLAAAAAEAEDVFRASEPFTAKRNRLYVAAFDAKEAFTYAAAAYLRSPEFAALVANDARYVWIRNSVQHLDTSGIHVVDSDGNYVFREALDTAIDTARKDTP